MLLLFVIWFCLLFFIVIRLYKIPGQKLLFFLLKLNLSYNNKIPVAVQDRFTRKVQNEFTCGGRRKTDRMTFWADGITGGILGGSRGRTN